MRCLEKRASDRPQSADEIVQALDAIATPSGGMGPTDARAAVRYGSRWRLVAAAGAVVAAGLLAYVLMTRGPTALTIGGVAPVTQSSEALNFDASISPDGKLVAYASGPAGAMRIFVKQAIGSLPIPLSKGLGGNHRWPRWSPDGTSIVFAAGSRIYEVPALGGAPKLLTTSGDMPSWSPDGKSIVFARASGIWVQNLTTSALKQIDTAIAANAPSWSPDGRRIAFVRGNLSFIGASAGASILYGNASSSSVWIVGLDGAEPRQVSDASHLNTSPAWLPDGSGIVYVSERDGIRDIYAQRLDKSGAPQGSPDRLTTGANAFSVTVSRDRPVLAYSTLLLRSNIWSAPILDRLAPPTSLRQLTAAKQDVEGLSVSHDGRWIAFDSNIRDRFHNIYKIGFDGTSTVGESVALTTDTADAFAPRWSPGDSELTFHSMLFGTRDVFTIRADGQGRVRVTTEPGHEHYYPNWSPDGRSIVYNSPVPGTSLVGPSNSVGGRRVFVVSRTGSGWGAPRSVSDPKDTLLWAGASWSPDGSWLGLLGSGGVWLTPPGGGTPRPVVTQGLLGELVTSIAWPHDARSIVIQTRDSSGIYSFWKVDVGGAHKPVRLLRLDEQNRRTRRAEFDTDGRRLFFTIAADEADVVVANLRRK
jgi:TolB protein